MDLFTDRAARPMVIGRSEAAFDDDGYIFELKLDGERALGYVGEGAVDIISRRNNRMTHKFPELAELHRQVKGRCILDGELVVTVDGAPNFEEIKRRSSTSDPVRIDLLARRFPVSYVVFDILYRDGQRLVDLPLLERRAMLESCVEEGGRISLSRYIEDAGTGLFQSATTHGFEGVVGKRKNSRYAMGKRSSDWVKCKNTHDDDYVVCGYIINEGAHVASLVLGQYGRDGHMVYCGHATLALSGADFAQIMDVPAADASPFAAPLPAGNRDAVWIEPRLVCTVEFTERGAKGLMRHPVYKTLRPDKLPEEALAPATAAN